MKNESGSSRMDTMLKLLLIVFVSVLAFSSGVYFGKQLSDSDYQLKALESDFSHGSSTAKTEAEAADDEAIDQKEVAALTDKLTGSGKSAGETGVAERTEAKNETRTEAKTGDETRKVASTEISETENLHAEESELSAVHSHNTGAVNAKGREIHTKLVDNHVHTPPADAHGKPDLSLAAKAANRVARNAAPEEPAKPMPTTHAPASVLPRTVGASHEAEFTVQVASYPTADAARLHANELVTKGFPAYPVEADIAGKVWYRVSVGSFKTKKEATVYRAQIMKQASLPSAIVQEIRR